MEFWPIMREPLVFRRLSYYVVAVCISGKLFIVAMPVGGRGVLLHINADGAGFFYCCHVCRWKGSPLSH